MCILMTDRMGYFMCGIAGFLGNEREGLPVVLEALHKMIHRGPDNLETKEDGEAVLGAVRLSIRDKREKAHQPFVSFTGRWIITFNGELNNHDSLRTMLGEDYSWRTESDTETIATALDAKGWSILTKLQGMFAIAAWDTLTKTLYLTRDFPGIKPLYWAETKAGSFIYASEFHTICGMLRNLKDPLTISSHKVVEYMMYRDTLLEPETLINSIKKISPGEVLAFNTRMKPKRLHLFEHIPNPSGSLNELEEKFITAIKSNIEFNQKMGMFLSGGVDSSTVLAELVHQGANIEAFSLRYEQTGAYSYSEIPFSRHVCKNLSVPLHELELTEKRFMEVLPTALSRQDGFSMDPTIVAYHELGAAAAKENIRIVVTGTGSDEIFGSYEWLHSETINHFDQWMRPATMPHFIRIDPLLWDKVQYKSFLKRKGLIENFQQQGFSLPESIRLFGLFHLEADALPRVDLGTMASSVECRVPLLDQEFVNTALSAPPDTEKNVFRSLGINRIPTEILNRPKCGFPHPVFVWAKHGELANSIYDLLSEGQFSEFINQDNLKGFFKDESSLLVNKPPAYLYDSASSLWYLFSFALWCDINKLKIDI